MTEDTRNDSAPTLDDEIDEISSELESFKISGNRPWPGFIKSTDSNSQILAYLEEVSGFEGGKLFPLSAEAMKIISDPLINREFLKLALHEMTLHELFLPIPLFTPMVLMMTTGVGSFKTVEQNYEKLKQLENEYEKRASEDRSFIFSEESKKMINEFMARRSKIDNDFEGYYDRTVVAHGPIKTSCDIFFNYYRLIKMLQQKCIVFNEIDDHEARALEQRIKVADGAFADSITLLKDQVKDDFVLSFAMQHAFEQIVRYGTIVYPENITLTPSHLLELCEKFTQGLLAAQEAWLLSVCSVDSKMLKHLLLIKQPLMDTSIFDNFPAIRNTLLENDAHISVMREAYQPEIWKFKGNPVIYDEDAPYILSERSMLCILEAFTRKEMSTKLRYMQNKSKCDLYNRKISPELLIISNGPSFSVYEDDENNPCVF